MKYERWKKNLISFSIDYSFFEINIICWESLSVLMKYKFERYLSLVNNVLFWKNFLSIQMERTSIYELYWVGKEMTHSLKSKLCNQFYTKRIVS